MFVVNVWGRAIERRTDTEYYCVWFEGLEGGNIEKN
jgi:hypothetical protein